MTVEQWTAEQIRSRGLKQKFVAEAAGMTEQALSFVCTGRRKLSAEEFIAVCRAAGIDPLGYPAQRGGEHSA